MKYYLITTLFLIPTTIASADQLSYTPIVGIPGVSSGNFDSYITSLYAISISVAALLAVIRVIVAGVKWMLTDVVTSKSEAKKDITSSLLGLIIVMAAVLILTVINPNIVNVNLSFNDVSATPAPGGGGSTAVTPAAQSPGPGYTYIPKDSSIDQINLFKDDCVSSGKYFEIGVNAIPRCIDASTATEGYRWLTTCTSLDPAMCAAQTASATTICSNEGSGGGTLTIDSTFTSPPNEKGLCIYPK
jgi:hypothetical protein